MQIVQMTQAYLSHLNQYNNHVKENFGIYDGQRGGLRRGRSGGNYDFRNVGWRQHMTIEYFRYFESNIKSEYVGKMKDLYVLVIGEKCTEKLGLLKVIFVYVVVNIR